MKASIHVVLAFDELPTDERVVLADPCRSDDEAIQATRIADSFRLELTTTPPITEDTEIRDFAAWLLKIPRVENE